MQQNKKQHTQSAKKIPVETTLIFKSVDIIGCSYMFAKGEKVLIQKKVFDPNDGKSVFQGIFFNKLHRTCVELDFDGETGLNLKSYPNEFNEKGTILERPSAYNISIDVTNFK